MLTHWVCELGRQLGGWEWAGVWVQRVLRTQVRTWQFTKAHRSRFDCCSIGLCSIGTVSDASTVNSTFFAGFCQAFLETFYIFPIIAECKPNPRSTPRSNPRVPVPTVTSVTHQLCRAWTKLTESLIQNKIAMSSDGLPSRRPDFVGKTQTVTSKPGSKPPISANDACANLGLKKSAHVETEDSIGQKFSVPKSKLSSICKVENLISTRFCNSRYGLDAKERARDYVCAQISSSEKAAVVSAWQLLCHLKPIVFDTVPAKAGNAKQTNKVSYRLQDIEAEMFRNTTRRVYRRNGAKEQGNRSKVRVFFLFSFFFFSL